MGKSVMTEREKAAYSYGFDFGFICGAAVFAIPLSRVTEVL
jgi:hypothetical protein